MTSERQVAANRSNAGRSTGPRTRQGKLRISRNALSHGLAALQSAEAVSVSDQTQQLAKAICQKETDPLLYDQALIIAESQIVLGRVRVARREAVERARKEMHMSEREVRLIPGFPTHNELNYEIYEHFQRGELRHVIAIIKQMNAAQLAAYKRIARGLPIWPAGTEAQATDDMKVERKHDDLACLLRALPEWLTLERYERRALSRRRRAMEMFRAPKAMSCYNHSN